MTSLLTSLRARLAALVLFTALPATVVLVGTVRGERELLEAAERDATLVAARQIVQAHGQALVEARGVLLGFAESSGVQAGDAAACTAVASRIRAANPAYANVGAVGLDGEAFCSAVPLPGRVSLEDRLYIKEAVRTGGFAIGDYQIGRITGLPSVNVGYPVRDAAGELRAIVFLAFDLNHLGVALVRDDVRSDATVTVVDGDGVVLVQEPRVVPVGTLFTDLPGHEGLLDAVGTAGRVTRVGERLVAVAPLGPIGSPRVVVSRPTDAAFAASDQNFAFGIGLVVVLAALTVGGAWWAGDRLFVQRVRALSDLAARLARGDLAARAAGAHGGDEIGQLSRSLDAMAGALELLTRRNRLIVASAGEGIVTLDPDGRVVSANPAAATMLGRAPQAMVQQRLHDLVHGDDHPAEACPLQRPSRESTTVRRFDEVFLRADGAPVPVHVVGSPIRDRGEVTGTVLVFADQRARVLLEEQLRQAQKMEVVGRLAGGVAHDFNNLLTAILGYGELLRDRLDPARAPKELDEMIKSAHRAAALTRQLLAFSRQEPLAPRVLDPNALVRGMDRLLRRVIGEDVALELAVDPAAANVKADAGQLEQVILNLAVNGRDAMARAGKLVIATHARGDRVEIAVTDDGAGMTDAVRARMFEPFFTTKATGTGLGLSIVRDIVARAGGTIEVETAIGVGSTFRVTLPGTSERVEPAYEYDTAALTGTETVLVVEDDAPVRVFARRALEKEGYLVIEAVDGEDAEACADAHLGPIHLLLTDMVMPGLDGATLAERLAATRPELRVLFMTGYAAPPSRAGVRGDVLSKPFGARGLATRVRAAIDGRRESTSGITTRPEQLPRA